VKKQKRKAPRITLPGQAPRRWHLFGDCGGWNEFHVWCVSKKQAMHEASPYVKIYGEVLLEDCKTNKIWRVKKMDNLDYIEKLAKQRKLI
jgi:hypothetical protein